MSAPMPPPVDLLGHVAAAAAEQPDAVTTLQNALSGLGHAYVAFGNAILAIDVKKATSSGTEGGGKKKRMKDKSDKKPRLPSAYNLFVKDESSKLRKEGNHATQQDLMRDLGTKWRELPTHEKEKYNARANAVAVADDDEEQGAKRSKKFDGRKSQKKK